MAGTEDSSMTANDAPLPCLVDVGDESPYFVAKLALESYRERLIQVFNFIDDAARCEREREASYPPHCHPLTLPHPPSPPLFPPSAAAAASFPRAPSRPP
jgi:hypothetical protein